jgi:DNA polymerase-3 subunit beta
MSYHITAQKGILKMKFNCERALLLNGITIASRTVATKSTIPALEGLLIEAVYGELIISGYNLKTGIRTRVPAEVEQTGQIVLNARLLNDIIRKMPEGTVSFTVENSFLVRLTCAMSNFEIMGNSAEDFPELPSVDVLNSIKIPEKILGEMISQTIFAVSQSDARPILTGSLFEIEDGVLTIVSLDGFRMALRKEKLENSDTPNMSFVVPGSALTEVEKIASDGEEMVTINLGTRHILFASQDTEIISRRLEGEYHDYKKYIPSISKYNFYANRKSITDIFERVSLVISEKYKCPVRCTFGNNVLKVSSATALGKAADECDISGDGEGLEIGFNNKYVLDTLKAVPSDEIKLMLNSSITPLVIVPADDKDNFLYLIVPLRIRTEE